MLLLYSFLFSILLSISICIINFPIDNTMVLSSSTLFWSFVSWINKSTISLYAIMGLSLYYFYCCKKENVQQIEKQDRIYLSAFVTFFSFIFLLGKSYHELGNWNLIFISLPNFALSLFGTGVLAYSVTNLLEILRCLIIFLCGEENKVSKIRPVRHYFLLFFLIGLVHLIIFYPGTATYDGVYQILEYYGERPLSNHLPVLATFIDGSIFHFGKSLYNANFGLFCFAFTQILFQSYVFARCMNLICRLNQNKVVNRFCLAFFLFNPIFNIWVITFVKDTIYYISLLWLLIIVIEIIEKKEEKGFLIGGIIQLLLASLLLFIFRNNGVFISIPAIITLAFYERRNKHIAKMLMINAVIIICIASGWSKFLSYSQIPQPVEEALSIPFQQTARLVHEKYIFDTNDLVTLSNLFNHKDIGSLYNPEFADPVKFSFKWGPENRSIWRKIYVKYLKLYPEVYAEAFFNQSYGYFYPLKKSTDLGSYEIPDNESLKNDILYVSHDSLSTKFKQLYSNVPGIFDKVPLLNLIYNCSIYSWSVLFLIGYSLVKRRMPIFIINFPLLLSLGVCLLSPVNACLRYMLPVIVCVPLSIVYYVYKR